MTGGVDEVESKHPVPDPATLVERLEALGFRGSAEQEQLDEYYDTPDGQLRRQDLVARLRLVAGVVTAGFKGPRTYADDGTYRRVEVEFPATGDVRDAFARQGLVAVWRLAKRRREFRRGDLVVAVDELPELGTFAEFEGDPAQITLAREQVAGLVGPPERRNYAELAADWLRGHGRPEARELTF
ncbi:CYTH domain-containing protein [Dactylosporangium sp. NPDC049525]|uniref:class IV adenylate cyclase n=1 Tax=Dactylosporangium sp. NPDC049525 TaxID=3154730 RepID=UPI0034497544